MQCVTKKGEPRGKIGGAVGACTMRPPVSPKRLARLRTSKWGATLPKGGRRLAAAVVCVYLLAAALLYRSFSGYSWQPLSARARAAAALATEAEERRVVEEGVFFPHDLLNRLLLACIAGQDTVIRVRRKDDKVQVYKAPHYDTHHPLPGCPLVDVFLAPEDRHMGLCQDAALYLVFLGGRLLPRAVEARTRNGQPCGNRTARLSLEPLYEDTFTNHPGTLHLMSPNHENLYNYDVSLHQLVDVFLCKTRLCFDLLRKYVEVVGFKAQVWLVGHTSLDPNHDGPPMLELDYDKFLHVRGKSSLKHTKETLECWLRHPEWPPLTVVGEVPNMQISLSQYKAYVRAGNIKILPGLQRGPIRDYRYKPLPLKKLRHLQVTNGVHLCPSEREGYGHYINEGRAVGALILTPDHPPMNELVNPETGLLITGGRPFSHRELPVLWNYANLSISISPDQICDAVEEVLMWTLQERRAVGRAARRQFLNERVDFTRDMEAAKTRLLQLLGRDP